MILLIVARRCFRVVIENDDEVNLLRLLLGKERMQVENGRRRDLPLFEFPGEIGEMFLLALTNECCLIKN